MIKINGEYIALTKFPNGERAIHKEAWASNLDDRDIRVDFFFDGDEDEIYMLQRIMFAMNDRYPDKHKRLFMPYIPYSRMDRENDHYLFSLKWFADLINRMNFDEVHTRGAHSKVSLDLINNIRNSNTSLLLMSYLLEDFAGGEDTYIILPDKGAQLRYGGELEAVLGRCEYKGIVTCNKERDFKTGRITSLTFDKKLEPGSKAIIIDDLCSRGGTFDLTINKLVEQGINDVAVTVTHCEDTVYDGVLLDNPALTLLLTTDSILSEPDPSKESHRKISRFIRWRE